MGTTGQSITLANSIIGVGILAMPFCFQQCGVLLATLILLLMGFVSRLCCHFLLKSAIITRRRTFEFLAFHVFGSAGKLAVEVGIIGFLMGTCIAYFVVVGDLGPQIIAKMLNINQSDILRTSIMVIVSLVCVLPLGLLRNVDSLSNVSAATICFYFCLVIKVILEATTQLITSDWHMRIETWKPSGVLQCVPIFSMALFCQTQLFEIFESLPSLSLEKMNVVTKNAINICTAVYFTLGFFGYVAFSSHNISGNILMSLSPTFASDVIKLGFVMSLAFSFPLIIFPCRASLYSFLYKKVHPAHHDHIINHSIPETTFRCITVAIIAVALFISLLLPNIELVLGLLGSTIGVLICVVFPAACFINVTFKNTNERLLAKVILVLGLIILVLGTYANLQAAEIKYDDKYISQERIDKIVEDFFEKMEKNGEGKPKPEIIPNGIENKPEKEKLIDSEVQPPNPVPPESHSNEKPPDVAIQADLKLKQIKLEQKVNKDVGVNPETQLKDLKMKEEESKLVNGNEKLEPVNIEKPKEMPNQVSNQDRMDMIKKQRLIETIKQQGEEQKELIKEQKEILHEILQTKKELEKDKKEKEENDAKKIAVESIQKIANMAIQSLSGVTDKPAGQPENHDKKDEPLEKIANDAIQEIAKKAAETLEAIGEKKEPEENKLKPVKIKSVKNNPQINNKQVKEKVANEINPQIAENNNLLQAAKQNDISKSNPVQLNKPDNIKPSNVVLNNREAFQSVESKNNVVEPVKDTKEIEKPVIIAKEEPKVNKEHMHAPDEPQSYKEGEDLLKKNVPNLSNSIAQNVPIAIVLKGNSQPNNEIQNNDNGQVKLKPNDKPNIVKDNRVIAENVIYKNGASNNIIKNNEPKDENLIVPRQKREVVDCTEKTLLKPEDKQICENLIDSRNNLPSDLKLDVGLPMSLQLSSNIVHRSLKSYKEDDRKR
ncbi:putative sodium-coupled neutral amino acid transporter 10 [Battus philenor]|uniref:putative sodium-coupled neutral amino acid transporter 10 n=1 Tax=Battus philenor TaxID=42288 RepID=UPI0035CEBFD0